MRWRMMILVGFGAVTLLGSAVSAQEPERERCRHLREEIGEGKQEARRHKEEGARQEVRQDKERIKRDRREYKEHRCKEILRD